jgi:putative ABC transport system permease protein
MGLTKVWSKRLRSLVRKRAADRELDHEIAFHLEMETEKYLREGLSPAEARRRAALAFGGVERHKEDARDERWLPWTHGLSLDFTLGFRMLLKYPGLTLVGGLAIAFAVWVGAGAFEVITQVVRPNIPLEDGSRIVGIRNWDTERNQAGQPSLRDFTAWRERLESVGELGAFRVVERNLSLRDPGGNPTAVAEMSASGFRVARVPARLGRTLMEEDEQPGATPVVVIGHSLWQRRFAGDPRIVGQQVRLGNTFHTVVGVMPEGFAFPIAHEVWVPLRLNVLDFERGQGPAVRVFGRLASGATLGEAQAELATLGRRAAVDFRATHEHIRPQVVPYAKSILDISGPESFGLMSVNLFLMALLVLVCGNVALLMFARAASRESEILVRTALGASRGRIIAQLFVEALVLAGVAATVGLAATGFGLRWMLGALATEVPYVPFWISDRVSATTVLYVAVLAVVGALVAGVLPALKVTRALGTKLRQEGAGGGGFRFGGVWTAVIVAQVAVTVAFPAAALFVQRESARTRAVDVGFASAQYLSARLDMDRPAGPATDAQAQATAEELTRRLEGDPAVLGVTFADRLPRMEHPHRRIDIDAGGAAPVDPAYGYRRVSSVSVALNYFDVLGVPILQGRGFRSGDLAPNAHVVIVNQSFVERVLGGRNPIGRHVRYLYLQEWQEPRPTDDQPWYEIIGVVRDLGLAVSPDPKVAGFYHPVGPGGISPVHVAVHVSGDPAAFAPRLRALAGAADPTLRINELVPLDDVNQRTIVEFSFWLVVLVSAVALLLSLAGIYAIMAFTVARRTREIGIRVALGADARRLVPAIFRRPLVQVGLGILLGGVFVATAPMVLQMEQLSAKGTALVGVYAVFMMAVCMLACIVPTRRALRVQPTEALRAG